MILTKRGFKKPAETEPYNIKDSNDNVDKLELVLDEELEGKADLIDGKVPKTQIPEIDSKDNTVTFEEAVEDINIASGEKHSILFGKILKSFKTIALTIGNKTSLITTEKDNLVDAINEVKTQSNSLSINKADKSQVLTNVPAGAKFTDTIYTHPTTAGNKHIPTGGASNQYLKYSASGTAVWSAPPTDALSIGGKQIDLTGLADGKTLKYKASVAKWVIDFGGIGNIYNLGAESFPFVGDPRVGENYTTVAEKRAGHLYLYAASATTDLAYSEFRTYVDLTNTKVLYFDIENTGYDGTSQFTIVGASDIDKIIDNGLTMPKLLGVKKIGKFARTVIGIDVSNLIGTYYVGVCAKDDYSSAIRQSEVKIYRIWGE